MIDFHNHILPGADDGAKNLEESLFMLKCAEEQGITDVVNTIHFQHPKMKGKKTDYFYVSSLKNKLEQKMLEMKIKIKIHLGAEVFFDFNLLNILDNPLVTFSNNKYMLVEFSTNILPKNYDKHLYELKKSGVTPIIAHPERYRAVQNDIDIIVKLINSGCLMQIDGGSLIGHFGKTCQITTQEMLSRNLVHVIGSDAHGIKKRNFCLQESAHEAMKYLNVDVSDLTYLNPQKIIEGKYIEPYEIYNSESKSLFYNIFNKFK